MKKLSFVLTILFLSAFGYSYTQAKEDTEVPQVRTWTINSGATLQGKFLELTEDEDGQIVRIENMNRSVARIPFEKLSQEDQKYVDGFTKPDAVPDYPLGHPKVFTVDGIEYKFRWCPPLKSSGTYSNSNEELKKGFWISEIPVTQQMWEKVMNPSSEFEYEPKPIRGVSASDSKKFCVRLSKKLEQKIELPTEAQWERACSLFRGNKSDWFRDLALEYVWFSNGQGSNPVHIKASAIYRSYLNDNVVIRLVIIPGQNQAQ